MQTQARRRVERFPYRQPTNKALAIEQIKQLLIVGYQKEGKPIPPPDELDRLANAKYQAYEERFGKMTFPEVV